MKGNTTIDAAGKGLGRLASRVALALRGKDKPGFLPYSTDLPKVTVKNLADADVSQKKLEEKFFVRYSGYPSGKKSIPAAEVWEKNKKEVLRHAVAGMLPQNRLKKRMLKNLNILNGEEK